MKSFNNFNIVFVVCIDPARLWREHRDADQYGDQPTSGGGGALNGSSNSTSWLRHLSIAASDVHHVVAQRVEKLKG